MRLSRALELAKEGVTQFELEGILFFVNDPKDISHEGKTFKAQSFGIKEVIGNEEIVGWISITQERYFVSRKDNGRVLKISNCKYQPYEKNQKIVHNFKAGGKDLVLAFEDGKPRNDLDESNSKKDIKPASNFSNTKNESAYTSRYDPDYQKRELTKTVWDTVFMKLADKITGYKDLVVEDVRNELVEVVNTITTRAIEYIYKTENIVNDSKSNTPTETEEKVEEETKVTYVENDEEIPF